jgi:hypothetical protein
MRLKGKDGRIAHCAGVRGQLADQAWTALALSKVGRTDEAVQLIKATEGLRGDNGAYYDADATDQGYLATRAQPLDANVALARAMQANEATRAQAQKVLQAFAGRYLFEGFEAASYALAIRKP